jgi:transcriptional regulator with XRE-family HTH domain
MDTSDADRYAEAVVATITGERQAQGITIERLSELTGINYSTLRRLLAGQMERDFGTGEIRRIAYALGLSPARLSQLAEDRMARTGGLSRVSRPAPSPEVVTDPRSLIRKLLDEPDNDAELNRRLGEAAGLTGVSGARMKRLTDEIRLIRQGELQGALDALPTTAEQRYAN